MERRGRSLRPIVSEMKKYYIQPRRKGTSYIHVHLNEMKTFTLKLQLNIYVYIYIKNVFTERRYVEV